MKLLIEVGGFDGHDSLKFYELGYRVYTFEPQKDLYDNLERRTRHLEHYNVIPKAVCLTDGKMMFHISANSGASSILPFKENDELIKHWGHSRTDIHYSGQSYEVDTTRLDTFIEENNLQESIIDYIHIDAQGVDLECLMSLGKYIQNVKEGVLETVIQQEKSIYQHQEINTLDNIKKFLGENNFQITSIQGNDECQCEFNVYFKSLE